MEIMQLDQSTAKKECNTRKGQHEKSATLKKMQHEKIWKKKLYCTRVHKWITSRPLTDRYTLTYYLYNHL